MSNETMNDTPTLSRPDANGVTRELSRVQIFKQVTKDRLLDIGDMLSLDTRRNKIVFTLVAFDEEYRAITRVRHYVDVTDAKLVCHDILNGLFSEWTDHKGTPHDDGLQARILTIRKDPKYRQPYVIKVDNGIGEQLPGGAVKMAQTTDSLTIRLSEWDARKMARTLLDYIRDWETVNFRKRQEAQTQIIPLPSAENSDGDVPVVAPTRNRYARASAN